MRRHARGPGIHIREDHTGPKLVLLQQVQGLTGHHGLIRVSHKLIQIDALKTEGKSFDVELTRQCAGFGAGGGICSMWKQLPGGVLDGPDPEMCPKHAATALIPKELGRCVKQN